MQTTRLLLSICALALLVSCAAEHERRGRHRPRARHDTPSAALTPGDAGFTRRADLRPTGAAAEPAPTASAPDERRRRRGAAQDAARGPVTMTVDPRIVKHRDTEFVANPISGVFHDLDLRPPAKVVKFYATPPSLFLETDGRPDAMPLGRHLTATEPDAPAYSMVADAGAIQITETAPPYRQGTLVLEDKYGGGLHYVDAVLGHWQLATDTVVWVTCHRTLPGDPPKKRLWTVETEALKKLLPPIVTAAAAGIR